ncbi:MAG: GAF domain-containing protein [Chloroflexi bacterium]|nr:GAF domain-containing protein [Chloroflexota bacterium]
MKKPLLPFIKNRFNLRVKLPLSIITLLVLSLVSFTILSVWVSRTSLTNALKQSLATEASLQVEGIRSYLTWTRSMAIDISTVAEALDLDEEASKKAIERMLADNEQVIGSTIAYEPYAFKPDMQFWAPYYNRTPEGSLVFTQLGTPENNYPAQDWYRLAKEANKTILSPAYFDAGGAKIWMVTWSVPFHDGSGKLKGVATTDIAFSQTQDIVQKIAVGKQGYAFLVDQNGVILGIGEQGGQYKTMEESALISNSSQQANAWNKMVGEMTQGKSGFVNLTDPQGKDVYVAYEPIGMDTGWSLGLAYPQSELFQPVVQLRNTLILFLVVVLVVASAILLFLSRSITRPLEQITTWAKSFSQGQMHWGTDLPEMGLHINTNDEIEDLADAFKHMSTELNANLTTLEERVSARTKDLAAVAEVGTATSTILETDKLLQAVVELTKERFNLYHSHIYLLDDSGKNLVLASGAGEPGRIMAAEKRSIPLDREQSLVARAARERKGVTVNDVTQEPDFLPNPLLPNTRSELAVPMIVGSNLIGVFDIQSDEVGRFTTSDIDIQTTLAAQVATSIQNVRSFEQSKAQADLESLVNAIGQKIQLATTVDDTLQIAIREIGQALGAARVSAHIQADRHDNITGEN